MNIIILNLNVSFLDTFVQKIMILTISKLQIDSPADSLKSCLSRVLIQSVHGEGANH